MPVPSLVTALSTTISSNSPAGSDNVFPDLDNYLRALSGFLASIRDNSGNGWVSPYLPITGYSDGFVGIATATPQVRFVVDRLGGSVNPPSYTAGTTAAFIGSATPSSGSIVNIVSGNAATGAILFGDTDADSRGRVQYSHATDSLALWTANSVQATITSAGYLGIGTASPSTILHLADALSVTATIQGGSGNSKNVTFVRTDGTQEAKISAVTTNLLFSAGTTEAMRLLNTGDVLINTTTVGLGKVRILDAGAQNIELTNLETNTTSKTGTITVSRYTNTEAPFALIRGVSGASTNTVYIGGSASTAAPATGISFYTGALSAVGATGTERMIINSGGDVGIGTTDPTGGYAWTSAVRVLGISGDASASTSSYGAIALTNNRATPSATDQFGILAFTSQNSVSGQKLKAFIAGIADGAGGVTGGYGGAIGFYTKADNTTANNAERMRITSDGFVGIGNINPSTALHVTGTVTATLFSGSGASLTNLPAPTALSTASGSAPSYSARAWVNFNGTGTVAIRADGNVSSITDNGTGAYTVNFTTAMADANYAVLATGGDLGSTNYQVVQVSNAAAPTTSAVRIQCLAQSGGVPVADDHGRVSVAIFR